MKPDKGQSGLPHDKEPAGGSAKFQGNFKEGLKHRSKEKPPTLKEVESVEEKLARLENELVTASPSELQPQPQYQPQPKSQPVPTVGLNTEKTQSKSGKVGRGFNMAAFWVIVVLSVFLANVPVFNLLLYPVTQFVTIIHELGHALAAILTGGHVNFMTVVSDGQGHGGLTGTQGGFPLLVLPAGYLFTTFFGCFLIYLGQFPRLSKAVLMGLGAAMILATVLFMVPTLLTFDLARMVQGVFSILWGLALGGGCIYMSRKLNERFSNLAVLFLAVQTALNSLSLLWVLVPHSLGLAGGGFSDATLMTQFIPSFPIFWVLLWVAISLAALFFTLKITYGAAILKMPKLNQKTEE